MQMVARTSWCLVATVSVRMGLHTVCPGHDWVALVAWSLTHGEAGWMETFKLALLATSLYNM